MAEKVVDNALSITTITDKIIDDGKGGELLETTKASTTKKEDLITQKAAIATWRAEAVAKHNARLAELAARESEIDTKIAKFK
jgi:hypothetical protein